MSWHPKITIEQYKQAIECKRLREETPSLGDLENEWGLTKNTLAGTLRNGIKRYDYIIAKERAAKMKEDALQKLKDKKEQAPRVLEKMVRREQTTSPRTQPKTQVCLQKRVDQI